MEYSSKTKKTSKDWMLGLNEATDQMAMANRVRWHGHVFTREDGHVLRRALDLEVNQITAELSRMWPPSLVGDTTRFKTLASLSHL